MKVWISGFSRAAAVSNLTAAILINSETFTPDNIFAYTFATPATTRDPIAYRQIYNICNSMDLIPQVPFSSWGYGRYGITLSLPSMEVNTDYQAKANIAAQTYATLTNQDPEGFYSSAPINWMMSKVIDMLIDLFPTPADYAEEFQELLIEAYQQQGMIGKLQYFIEKLPTKPTLYATFTKEGDTALSLISNIGYTLLSEIAGENAAAWMNDLDSPLKTFHEHMPEVYVGWLFSTNVPEDLFEHPDEYTQVITSKEMPFSITNSEGVVVTDRISTFIFSNELMITLPGDDDYTITSPAKRGDGQVAVLRDYLNSASKDIKLTDAINFFDNEELVVFVPMQGEATITLSGVPLGLSSQSGLQSISTEFSLKGNSTSHDLDEFLVYLFLEVIPRLVLYAIILLAFLVSLIGKRKHPRTNEPYTAVKPWGLLLKLAGFAFIINTLMHCIMLMAYTITYGNVAITNALAMRVSRVLGISTQAYEASEMIVNLLMAILCFKGRKLQLTRLSGAMLCRMMMILAILTAIGGVLIQSDSIVSELLVLALTIATSVFFHKALPAELRQATKMKQKNRKKAQTPPASPEASIEKAEAEEEAKEEAQQ